MRKLRLVACVLLACTIAVGFSGCRLLGGGDDDDGGGDVNYVGPTGSISGQVSVPSNVPLGNVLDQFPGSVPAVQITLWLQEDRANNILVVTVPVGGSIKYLFPKVKPGKYHVCSDYKTMKNGKLTRILANRSSEVSVEARAEPVPVPALALLEAKNVAMFKPLDKSGNPITIGLTFRLWGEEFPLEVINGVITTPPLPDGFALENIEIIVAGTVIGFIQPPFSTAPVVVTIAIDVTTTGGGGLIAEVGKIAGVLLDEKNKQPIVGALVTLSPANRSTITDANGYFEFLEVKPGTYDLVASRDGYKLRTFPGIVVQF